MRRFTYATAADIRSTTVIADDPSDKRMHHIVMLVPRGVTRDGLYAQGIFSPECRRYLVAQGFERMAMYNTFGAYVAKRTPKTYAVAMEFSDKVFEDIENTRKRVSQAKAADRRAQVTMSALEEAGKAGHLTDYQKQYIKKQCYIAARAIREAQRLRRSLEAKGVVIPPELAIF